MFTYKIYAAGVIDREVNPVNSDRLFINYTQEDGQKFFRQKLSEAVILCETGSRDYSPVYAALLANKCTEFSFTILNNGNTEFSGVFTYYSIKNINEDTCEISINIETDDPYRHVFNRWKQEYNVLTVPPVTAQMTINPIAEYQQITAIGLHHSQIIAADPGTGLPPVSVNIPIPIPSNSIYTPYYPAGLDWKINDIQATITDLTISPYGSFPTTYLYTYTFDVELNFIRELLYVPPIGGSYTDPDPAIWHFYQYITIGGVTYKIFSKYYTNNAYNTDTPTTYTKNISGTDYTLNFDHVHYYLTIAQTVDFDRARLLSDVLDYFISAIAVPGVTGHDSQFFYQLPNNPVTGSAQKLATLLIGQKSDFRNPISSDPATRGMITVENLLGVIREMFKVYWHIEGGKFIFEHELYYENGKAYGSENIGLDVTAIPRSARYMKEYRSIDIDFKMLVGRETFSWAEAENADFIGTPILYDQNCIPNQQSENRHDIAKITTDMAYVWEAGESISKDGFVMLQTAYDALNNIYLIENETGQLLTFYYLINGHLSFSALHERYWKPGVLPVENVRINDIVTTCPNPARLKSYKEITVPVCGTTFEPMELVNTVVGVGKCVAATNELTNGVIRLSVKY